MIAKAMRNARANIGAPDARTAQPPPRSPALDSATIAHPKTQDEATEPAGSRAGASAVPKCQPAAPRAAALDPEPPAQSATTTAIPVDQSIHASLEDSVVVKIAAALECAGDSGLTRTQIRDALGRNVRGDRIAAVLELLRANGRTAREIIATGGRPRELWRAAKRPNPVRQ